MPLSRFKILFFAAPLLLAGCGEGYERVAYDGFPYGNKRTAGHGVAYVRANMLPERGPVIEPEQPANASVMEPPPLPEPEPEPPSQPIQETKDILDKVDDNLEQMFNESQRK